MSGKTSSAVKNRWNKERYKQIAVKLDKDLVTEWENAISENGITKAEFIRNAIVEYLNGKESRA